MDQEQTIDIPGVGPVTFPSSMSDDDITAAAHKLFTEANAASDTKPVSAEDFTPKSVNGFASNIVEDAKGIIGMLDPRGWKGMAQRADEGKRQWNADAEREFNEGEPKAYGMWGDRLADGLSRLPGVIANEAYERPVSAALAAAPVVPPVLRGARQAAGAVSGMGIPARAVDTALGVVSAHPVRNAVRGMTGHGPASRLSKFLFPEEGAAVAAPSPNAGAVRRGAAESGQTGTAVAQEAIKPVASHAPAAAEAAGQQGLLERLANAIGGKDPEALLKQEFPIGTTSRTSPADFKSAMDEITEAAYENPTVDALRLEIQRRLAGRR